ncbi:MAG: tRNA dihydrouridine(20/20a) synthase DusA [Gammaproteobacteria bacterium]|nr:tRNA dihydrouridine(20/20a) synthase DusA [Gammaproteobacteria bacterium]
MLDRKLSVAPMLDWTDRFCRYFLRLISKRAMLYTEMVTTGALINGNRERFLKFDPIEHPVALQLGGSDPKQLSLCSKLGQQWNYDEINLNLGCPSDRVQSGRFGACLMAEPELVSDCIKAMCDSVAIPVTVKQRIGIDHLDSYQLLCDFIGKLSLAGTTTFIIHARKAWLQGLSPKENREIPPLNYATVYQLKTDFPHLEIIINGGITSITECEQHLSRIDGVMIGREAYHNPWILMEADGRLFGDKASPPTRDQVIGKLLPFVERELAEGVPLNRITRHILGLFHGQPGARSWRRYLSNNSYQSNANANVIIKAAAQMRAGVQAE